MRTKKNGLHLRVMSLRRDSGKPFFQIIAGPTILGFPALLQVPCPGVGPPLSLQLLRLNPGCQRLPTSALGLPLYLWCELEGRRAERPGIVDWQSLAPPGFPSSTMSKAQRAAPCLPAAMTVPLSGHWEL